MSAVNAFESALLGLLFQNAAITNVGDAAGILATTTAGTAQLRLYGSALSDTTADLTGNLTWTGATTSGVQQVTRASGAGGWTISVNTQVANSTLIQFGEKSDAGTVGPATHVGLGFIATGNIIRLWAALNSGLSIAQNVNPQFAAAALVWTLD